MTTDVKLLLLPDAWQCETRICPPLFTPNQMQSYARANMAELLAENERLRTQYQQAAETMRHDPHFTDAERQERARHYEQMAERLEEMG